MADTESTTRKPLNQAITEVDILNGQAKGDLMRQLSPDGEIVLHAIRKNAYVHDRMYNNGKGNLDRESFNAAEQFRRQFERGQLLGHFAKFDMFRTSGGRGGDLSDAVIDARKGAIAALDQFGKRKDGSPNFSAGVVWFVVGEGMTLEDWSQRVRWNGGNMDKGRASGILISSLERLALHYGISTMGSIKDRLGQRKFAGGVAHCHSFIKIYMATAPEKDRAPLKKLIADIEQRLKGFLIAASP